MELPGRSERKQWSEQRYIYNNCIPSGNIDLQNIAVGSIVKRQWSLFVNGDVKPQGTLRA